jgi:hypothetical protein
MAERWQRPSGSAAVMNQRIEPTDSLDDFPTPPWATRALVELVLRPRRLASSHQFCWEPACNRGSMADPLRAYFRRVIATDIHHYGYSSLHAVGDFLDRAFTNEMPSADWIITNPPFRLALEFAERALDLTNFGVALFARSNWIEGQERYLRLFKDRMPSIVAHFAERVPLVKGYVDGEDERGGYDPDASSATAYSWFVWIAPDSPPARSELVIIPPGQRQALEHPTDRRCFAKRRHTPLFGELA